MEWPTEASTDTLAVPEGREDHTLDVYLVAGEVVDVRLDGESVWPTWFKIEWKGTGDVSAKVRGLRLTSRYGDVIAIHDGQPPAASARPAGRARAARE